MQRGSADLALPQPCVTSPVRGWVSDGAVEVGPGVGMHFAAVGAEHSEVLTVEGERPVTMLVQEGVVSSTERGAVVGVGGSARFPGDDVVEVAPGSGDLTAGPLAMGAPGGDRTPLGGVPDRGRPSEPEDLTAVGGG